MFREPWSGAKAANVPGPCYQDGEGCCGWGKPVTEGTASPAIATYTKTQVTEKGSSVFHNFLLSIYIFQETRHPTKG